ncbi:MAG: hypothetical protein ACR2IV_14490 [Bryobacteraceae bacterium]
MHLTDYLAGTLDIVGEFSHLAADTVKLVLMSGTQCVELADFGVDAHFLHNQRIPGCNGFDFGEGERGVFEILDPTRGNLAAHDLGDKPGFDFKELPHIGVEGPGGDVTEHAYLGITIALP